jgi:hypothetical protein
MTSRSGQETTTRASVQVDFFCVGGNKCGTTWLSEMARQHPDLNVSSNKEPQFFDNNWDKGWDWYARNWTEKTGAKGEFSTSYLQKQDAIERIAEHFPDAKIIAVLRQPLDRAISHFRQILRMNDRGGDDHATFLEKWPTVVRCSTYASKIGLYGEKFPPHQVKILLYDQIKNQPRETLQQVFRFLGVDPEFSPPGLDQVIGKGFAPRSRAAEKLRVQAYRMLQRMELYNVIVFFKRIGLAEWFRRVNTASESQEQLREALLPQLPHFLADIEELRRSPLVEDKETLDRWLAELRNAA